MIGRITVDLSRPITKRAVTLNGFFQITKNLSKTVNIMIFVESVKMKVKRILNNKEAKHFKKRH